jgi:hypothetical protein
VCDDGCVVRTVVFMSLGLLFTLPGVVLLYGSSRPDPRWQSSAVRAVAVLMGFAWLALGLAFITAAWTSGGTSRDFLIGGGLVAVGCAIARRVVRERSERGTAQAHVAQNGRAEP